jgi:hypothetical protein
MIPPTNLPSHLSVEMFRRYESFIALAVNNFPEATRFTPIAELTLNTFTARLRDSITSFRRYEWETSIIDVKKFKEIDGRFVVKIDSANHCCYFCVRGAAGRAPEGMTVPGEFVPVTNKPSTSGFLSTLTTQETEAFALLLSNKRIDGPVLIIGELNKEFMESLMLKFDIGYSYDPISNTSTIL